MTFQTETTAVLGVCFLPDKHRDYKYLARNQRAV